MQRICFKRLTRGFFGHAFQGARPIVIDDDRAADDGESPPGDFDVVDATGEKPACRLPDDPGGGEKEQGGFDQGGNAFDLGVTVMMLVIGWLVST